MKNKTYLKTAICLVLTMTGVSFASAASTTVEKKIEKPVVEAIDIRQVTQKSEEKWHQEQKQMLELYERLEKERAELSDQEKQLQKENGQLTARIEEKRTRLQRIQQLAEQLSPFLLETVQRLQAFAEQDLPFLQSERKLRVSRLQETMADPEIAMNEKMRKLFEALMIEMEYGQTIEVTRETIQLEGKETLVDIFRLGRVGLYFQTLDNRAFGFYNVAAQSWQPLEKNGDAIALAMEIGRKQRPAELISLPLGRLKVQ